MFVTVLAVFVTNTIFLHKRRHPTLKEKRDFRFGTVNKSKPWTAPGQNRGKSQTPALKPQNLGPSGAWIPVTLEIWLVKDLPPLVFSFPNCLSSASNSCSSVEIFSVLALEIITVSNLDIFFRISHPLNFSYLIFLIKFTFEVIKKIASLDYALKYMQYDAIFLCYDQG